MKLILIKYRKMKLIFSTIKNSYNGVSGIIGINLLFFFNKLNVEKEKYLYRWNL